MFCFWLVKRVEGANTILVHSWPHSLLSCTGQVLWLFLLHFLQLQKRRANASLFVYPNPLPRGYSGLCHVFWPPWRKGFAESQQSLFLLCTWECSILHYMSFGNPTNCPGTWHLAWCLVCSWYIINADCLTSDHFSWKNSILRMSRTWFKFLFCHLQILGSSWTNSSLSTSSPELPLFRVKKT